MVLSIFNLEEKSIWNVFVALLMFWGGMSVLVFIYLWLAWYASLNVTRQLAANNIDHSTEDEHGMSKSDIQKLPTVVCTSNVKTHHQEKGDDGDDEEKSNDELWISDDLECAVCLDQFNDGVKCLLMPTCKHCFHLECAGAWLSRHSICPLCRTTAFPKDEEQQEQDPAYSSHIPDSTFIDIPS